MKKVMLINVLQAEETRIAILEDGILEELYVERVSNESYVGNIYKGRVVNIEPSIQAAFIDFGVGRNGFLHISDVDPQYFNGPKNVEILGGTPAEPERGNRGGRGERSGRGERQPRDRAEQGERQERDGGERQERAERSDRGERHERGGRSGRQERGGAERQERGGAERQERGGAERQERGGAERQERGGAERQERGGAERQERGGAERQERGGAERQERGGAERQERGGERQERGSQRGQRRDSSGGRNEGQDRGARDQQDRGARDSQSRRDRGGRRESASPNEPWGPGENEPFLEPQILDDSRDDFGRDVDEPMSRSTESETDDREGSDDHGHRDEGDANRRGPRRRGRRGRGRRKRESVVDSDIPEELITDSESLPDLDDFKIDEDESAQPKRSSERPSSRGRDTHSFTPREPERPVARAPEPPARPPEPPPVVPQAPPEVEYEFGEGLLDEDDDKSAFFHEESSPPGIEPQRGYYRRLDANDDDEAGFGSGIFEDEIAEPPTDVSPAPHSEREEVSDLHDEPGLSFSEEEEEAIGPEPRVDRYDDEDSPLDSWADFAEHAESEEPVVDRESPAERGPATEEESEGERSRRRRRRGGRGRRGRNRDDAPASEQPEVFESEIVDHEEEHDDDFGPRDLDELGPRDVDDFGPRDFEDREPGPRVEQGPDERRGRRGDRGGDRGGERGGRGGRPQGRNGHRGAGGGGGGARRPRQRPPIQDIFKRGQEVLVQVIKEGIGNKGPTLSTYISIPGRYLVLMPGLNRVGVSRKIIDEEQRKRLREVVADLERPKSVGFIIRTAGLERTKKELERDLAYLCRLWEVVVRRIRNQKSPTTIYQESDMIIRTIRDIFTSEIDTIYIDEPAAYERAREFLQFVMPKYVDRLKLYDKSEPLFHHYGIEDEISRIQQRAVPLPHGGSIVIDQTEAMVAIDVNSGNFRADGNAEETAFQINMTAAREIARQLRLRDLGGVIVNDFIDMREERHRRSVENALRDAVRRDRARTKILRMSAFGLVEMTRQRIRPSLRRSLYRECAVCHGTGHIKTVESVSIDCMRLLAYVGQRGDIRRIQLSIHPEIATYMQNHKRQDLAAIEQKWNLTLNIIAKDTRSPEDITLLCWDANGDPVHLNGLASGEDR